MAFDDTKHGTLMDTECPTAREEFLVKAVDEKYGDSAVGDIFLNTAFRDAGGHTPRQMALESFAGLETAMSLLHPVSGC